MCGVAGLWSHSRGPATPQTICRGMTDALRHRGPDAAGVWIDPSGTLALGHRRLAVLDTSDAGHQPMRSASGRWTITFNGEVYNYRELWRQLEREGACPQLAGGADTEVLLAAIDAWGVRRTLSQLNGMFAFGVWDHQTRTLTLARDRMGIKPLYYGRTPSAFLFGSELRAIVACPDFEPLLYVNGLAQFLRSGYFSAPYTVYEHAHTLKPGCLVELKSPVHPVQQERYWSLPSVIRAARPLVSTPTQAVDQLEALLLEAVNARMTSDVPLGAFLSGGYDSSLVVSLMQRSSPQPVRTFSIGFEDPRYDEARHANAVATHLGTDHTERYVTAKEAREVIPTLPDLFDEPFADSSQIPTLIVSRLARSKVTVALGGDGGDELFAGYDHYAFVPRLWGLRQSLPSLLRRGLIRGLRSCSATSWNRLVSPVTSRIPGADPTAFGARLHKLATIFESRSPETLFEGVVSTWLDPTSALVIGADQHHVLFDHLPSRSLTELMMLHDAQDFLPSRILTKVDRASMSTGLEARVPLLDHRVVEFAWRLPHNLKVRDGQRKWISRQVLYRHVPRALLDRPKMGFSPPLSTWLRGPLRSWAETLLSETSIARYGVFCPQVVRATWAEHLAGVERGPQLWHVLMLQAWLERHPHTLPQC